MKNNIITRKIKISFQSNEELNDFLDIQRQYSNLLRYTYNRVKEQPNISTKDLTVLQHKMNNINLNSHFLNSAIYDAKTINECNQDKKVIFGGKNNFINRIKGNISKDEFKSKRLSPIYSVGEAPQKGNRFISIIDDTHILFKPNRSKHIILNLNTSKTGKKELLKIKELMESRTLPVTVRMSQSYIYLTFDYNKIKEVKLKTSLIRNRIMSIDQNPNYIGWTVIDWHDENNYTIIDKGVISNKPLSDKWFSFKDKGIGSNDKKRIYLVNKRNYEICKIGQLLTNLARHYQCNIFAIEKLNFKDSNPDKSKRVNTICNNLWCRTVLYSQLRKYTSLYNITFLEVISNYSSFIGNLVYRQEKLPDMILASIEISRRSYEFYHQYILGDKQKEKNIILPKLELVKERISKSLEELKIPSQFETLIELYSAIKKSKHKYRLSLEECMASPSFSSKDYKRKGIILYTF